MIYRGLRDIVGKDATNDQNFVLVENDDTDWMPVVVFFDLNDVKARVFCPSF